MLIAALMVLNRFEDIVKFSAPRGSPDPTVSIALLGSPMILGIGAVWEEWHILAWINFWLPFALIFAASFAVARLLVLEVRNSSEAASVCCIFCAAYAFGLTLELNANLGTSESTYYQAKVLDKYYTTGKHTTYYFVISTWGPCNEPKELTVDQDLYNSRKFGDPVSIQEQTGKFGIPFYFVK